jgi:hypothetical protein
MTVSIGGKNVATGAIIAAVGGALAIVGAFMAWMSFTVGKGLADMAGDVGESFNGFDENAGKLAVLVGIVAVAAAVAWAAEIKVPYLPVIVVAAGVGILAVAGLAYFTDTLTPGSMQKAIDDGNKALDVLKSMASAYGVDVSGTSIGLGIGFYLEILAGVLVIVGGAMGLMKKSA